MTRIAAEGKTLVHSQIVRSGASPIDATGVKSPSGGQSAQPTRWQFVIASGIPRVGAANRLGLVHRADTAHASVLQSHLPLVWNRQVGWHVPSEVANNADHTTRNLEVVRASPPRPKMLRPIAHNRSDATWDTPAERSGQPASVRLAHEIAVPLRAAQQTIEALAHQVRINNHLSLHDAERLTTVANSLSAIARWADDTLVGHESARGSRKLLRQRFNAKEWFNALRGLLNGTAATYGVSLNWLGWTHPLPMLYLDFELLSRALHNLVHGMLSVARAGSAITIKASWQPKLVDRLLITIETESRDANGDAIQLINGSHVHDIESVHATSLVNAKAMLEAQCASVSAHNTGNRTLELQMSLPIDTPEALIRAWIAPRAKLHQATKNVCVDLYAVMATSPNAEQANRMLQSAASATELVVRVAENRWYVAELKDAAIQERSAVVGRLESARDGDKTNYGDVLSAFAVHPTSTHWKTHLVHRTCPFGLGSIIGGSDARVRLPQIVKELAIHAQKLIGNRPLILDGSRSASLGYADGVSIAGNNVRATAEDKTASRSESKFPSGRVDPHEIPGAELVSEIIKHWKVVQAKLADLDHTIAAKK